MNDNTNGYNDTIWYDGATGGGVTTGSIQALLRLSTRNGADLKLTHGGGSHDLSL